MFLRFEVVTPTLIVLYWQFDRVSDGPNWDGYHVERNGVVVATLPAGAVDYRDESVTPGEFYCYSVVPYNRDGRAAFPPVICARTVNPRP